MIMRILDRAKICIFFSAVLLLAAQPASAAAPDAISSSEAAKQRTELQKTFLLRSSDELKETLAFVNEMVAVLIRQVEAAAGRETEGKTDERLALLDWYQRHEEWLRGMTSETDAEVSAFFGSRKWGAEWTARYEDLARTGRKFAGDLGNTLQRLEGEKKKVETRMQKVNTAVVERRVLVDKEDLELARELWPAYKVSYDRREAVYKELTDEEVLRLQHDLQGLKERQQYFECLAELSRYEQVWMDMKTEDFTRMKEIAAAIDAADTGGLAYALRSAIRTYEADIALLKRRSGELKARVSMDRSGTFKMLDLQQELSHYYEAMKSRFDRQIDRLSVQIGSCRADLVEIGRMQ